MNEHYSVIVPDHFYFVSFVQEANKKLCAVVPAVKVVRSTTPVQSANTCRRPDSSNELYLNKSSKGKVRRKKETPVASSSVVIDSNSY